LSVLSVSVQIKGAKEMGFDSHVVRGVHDAGLVHIGGTGFRFVHGEIAKGCGSTVEDILGANPDKAQNDEAGFLLIPVR
jgi:hypothetical protein